MTPERLLTDLRMMNVRVRADGDLIRCKPPEGAVCPVDLTEQIRALKPQLLELLRLEEQEIAWRVELLGAGGEREATYPISDVAPAETAGERGLWAMSGEKRSAA